MIVRKKTHSRSNPFIYLGGFLFSFSASEWYHLAKLMLRKWKEKRHQRKWRRKNVKQGNPYLLKMLINSSILISTICMRKRWNVDEIVKSISIQKCRRKILEIGRMSVRKPNLGGWPNIRRRELRRGCAGATEFCSKLKSNRKILINSTALNLRYSLLKLHILRILFSFCEKQTKKYKIKY